ncbi:MAG: hypothetical protein ABR976_09170 [Terracidiphilus sp.]
MNKHGSLLPLIVFIALAAAQATASTPPKTVVGEKKSSDPKAQSQLLKAAPAAPTPDTSRPSGQTFEVNDVKGLLLTCTAPELESNPDTDVFKSCTLAPGRTLDDVMHTFIQAIHLEENERAKERAESTRNLDEKSAQKPAQK